MEMFDFLFKRRENDLLQRIKEKEKQCEELKKLLEKRTNDDWKKVSESPCSIDWKTMRVFSIERNLNKDGDICTIIGFFINSETTKDGCTHRGDSVHEWYLFCGEDMHQKLVDEFNQHRMDK